MDTFPTNFLTSFSPFVEFMPGLVDPFVSLTVIIHFNLQYTFLLFVKDIFLNAFSADTFMIDFDAERRVFNTVVILVEVVPRNTLFADLLTA